MQEYFSKHLVTVGHRSDGTSIDIPIVTVKGHIDGPRLLVQAGAHGDEFTGVGVIMKLIKQLKPEELSGQVTLIPVLHTGAMDSVQRFSAFDGLDLASSYLGNKKGFLTERIASSLIEKIVNCADAVVDLHTSEIWGDAYGYINCAPSSLSTGDESVNMARAFGFRWLVQPRDIAPNLLRSVLAEYDIPSIGIELGGLGIWRAEQIEAVLQGVVNVMKYLGALPGKPSSSLGQVVLNDYHWIHATSGGFFSSSYEDKDFIPKGEKIGEVCDWFGDVKESIIAPYDSVVLIERLSPLVKTGDQLILVGNLECTS